MSLSRAVGVLFGAIEFATVGLAARVFELVRRLALGSLLFWLLIVGTGVWLVVGDVARLLDRALAWVERVFVSLAMVAMTLLVFNEYLARELRASVGDLYGLFSLEGQSNVAVLLMVLVGFAGASLATRTRQHLTVDAVERVLSAGPARTVRRLTRLVSAVLCALFAKASASSVFTHSQDAFEGVTVFRFLVWPINAVVGLLPGDKYGPVSCKHVALDAAARADAGCPTADFPTGDAWIDATYDAGLDPFDTFAFGFVDAGDRFPLWLPLGFLAFAFTAMALRFLAEVVSPSIDAKPDGKAQNRTVSDVVLAGVLPGALVALGLGLWLGDGAIILIGSIALVLLGAPLFVAVGVGTVASWVLLRNANTETVISDMFEATKKLELLSIPFFVLAGNLMTKGSIATRLIAVARAVLGNVPGGLGAGAVAACALFAAISGSSPVTVIAIGGIMFPMLVREGYPERYAMGVLSTAGGLGIVIPPSIPMIVYAIMVSGPEVGTLDPAVLFKAGILPGALIASALVVYTLFLFWPREGLPKSNEPLLPRMRAWGSGVVRATARGILALFLPMLILGGIYGWLSVGPVTIRFTVTEAAAVAVVYALVVELFIHRELRWRDVPGVFAESSIQMGALFVILVIAISLNRFFVFEDLPAIAAAWLVAHISSPVQFLIMANLFLLALGCVMDILSAILIVAPLLAPIAAQYGINPVHFAILFIVNLEIGYLTPPMGINLFVASTVFERPVLEVIRSVLPFLVVMFVCLALLTAFPAISLWLVTE